MDFSQRLQHNLEPPFLPSTQATAAASVAAGHEVRRVLKEAWLALHSHQPYALFECATDAMLIVDEHSNVIDINAAACILLDASREALIGCCLSSFIAHEGDRPDLWDLWKQCPNPHGEFRLVQPKGDVRDVEYSVSANFLPDHHLVILRDVSDRKKANEELRLMRDRLHCLLQNTPAVIYSCAVSEDRRTTYISENIVEVLGYQPESLLSASDWWIQRIHPEDRERALDNAAQALVSQNSHAHEYRFLHANGQYRWLHDEIRCVRNTQGEPSEIVGYFVDISDRKQFEQSLQQKAQQEAALNHLMGAIRASLDLGTIFSVTAAQIAELFGGEVSIVKYVPERSCWVHQAVFYQGQMQESKLTLEIADANNPIAEQLKKLQVVQIDNTDTLADPINKKLATEFPGAWLMTPINVDGQIWGSLTLGRVTPALSWQEHEIDLARRVADQLAIAIHQSELHAQLHDLNQHLETQVRERTQQLQQSLEFEALLRRITEKVRDSLDEQQILGTVVRELAHALDLECCDTGIYDAEKTMSTIVCEHSRSLAPAQGTVFSLLEVRHPEVYNRLFQGKVCLFCDIKKDIVRADQLHLTKLVCPIFDDQEVLGDLWLFRRIGAVFSEEEIRLAQQVAAQCAIALRQARLYQVSQSQIGELERLNCLKDDFLSSVSHELRSPMANIKMSTEMLELQMNRLGILGAEGAGGAEAANGQAPTYPSIQRYFQILKDECLRETHLINDLLDLARLESEREVLSLMTLHLHPWIAHITESFLERAQRQQVQLQVQVPETLLIETDLSCLERMLTELLHNACKYTPPGGLIQVAATAFETQVEIYVSNTGIEISPQEQRRIFDKFYRIPGTDPFRYGGTGLGLTLVKQLAHHLGGDVRVQSGDRQTRFTLSLPKGSPTLHPSHP